jgi:hypothetical protein
MPILSVPLGEKRPVDLEYTFLGAARHAVS